MSTPEELLCSRKWRMKRGTWMLWGWFPFAWTAWVGYLIIGIKARSWKWIAIAIGFFALGLGSMIAMVMITNAATAAAGNQLAKGEPLPEPWSTYSSLVLVVLLVVWLGNAAVVQWFVNRKWLVWRARNNNAKSATPWYATATATPGAAAGGGIPATQVSPVAAVDNALRTPAPARVQAAPPAMATASPLQAAPAPATPQAPSNLAPPAPGTLHAPGTATGKPDPLDLNTATRDQLAALPGIDLAWADHIIATRSRVGGFANPADLVTAASVQPHVFAGIRDRLVATPPAAPELAVPTDGRRLEF